LVLTAETGEKGQSGVTGVDSVLVLFLSSIKRGFLSGDEGLLFTDFLAESSNLGSRFLDVLFGCI